MKQATVFTPSITVAALLLAVLVPPSPAGEKPPVRKSVNNQERLVLRPFNMIVAMGKVRISHRKKATRLLLADGKPHRIFPGDTVRCDVGAYGVIQLGDRVVTLTSREEYKIEKGPGYGTLAGGHQRGAGIEILKPSRDQLVKIDQLKVKWRPDEERGDLRIAIFVVGQKKPVFQQANIGITTDSLDTSPLRQELVKLVARGTISGTLNCCLLVEDEYHITTFSTFRVKQ